MPQFPYTRISAPFSGNFLKIKNCPFLRIGIRNNSGQMVKVESYIDTGAQFCMFDNSYAKLLGIKDYKQTKGSEDILPISGIGGRKPENIAYFHDLQLVIFKDTKQLEFKNALQTIDTKIGFLEKSIEVSGVLGVYGFLDHFTFLTNIPDGYFQIEPKF